MDKTETKISDESAGLQRNTSTDGDSVESGLNSQTKIASRRRMWPVWGILILYIVISIYSGCLMEWQAFQYGVIDDSLMITRNRFMFVLFYLCFHAAIALAAYRMFAHALVIATICLLWFTENMFHEKIINFKMVAKAHLFAAYPDLCQYQIIPDKTVSLCYGYVTKDSYTDETTCDVLVFNPGDELLHQNSQLMEEIKYYFVTQMTHNNKTCVWHRIGSIKHIAGHFYWVTKYC